MTDSTTTFFNDLSQREHQPYLAKAHGRLCFEVVDGERTDYWLVSMAEGDVQVAHENGKADFTLRGPKTLFDDVLSGKSNLLAAIVRGAFTFAGDPTPLGPFQRLLPGPATSSHPRAKAGAVRRQA